MIPQKTSGDWKGRNLFAPGYHAGNYPITARMFVFYGLWVIKSTFKLPT